MELEVPISFVNDFQRDVFSCTSRNQCASGGYGNGKTWVLCSKAIFLATTFPNYRVGIFRKVARDLRDTTMATFFKICPPALYAEKHGGRRADSFGELRLINGSEFLFRHLDNVDTNIIRGLEVNSVVIDQAEEISEEIYDHLDARVGRWDKAEIPPQLRSADFPINPVTGSQVATSYMMIACNPDHYLHWIYQRYHPDSDEHTRVRFDADGRAYSFAENHKMFEADSRKNPTLTKTTLDSMLRRDATWVRRFVEGKWGIPEGSIHTVDDSSIVIDPSDEFLRVIRNQGLLYRVLDHGDAAPTCCLWFAKWRDYHICYREYYQDQTLISEHRKNIHDLSVMPDGRAEVYAGQYADPSIFKKASQKAGSFFSVADEYLDSTYSAPPICWQPADNNEFLSRNRLNEVLAVDLNLQNPFTKELGSPKVFFIKQSKKHPHGCYYVIHQTKAQKRMKLTTVNGVPVFSDERDESIDDHAYDPLRYYFNLKISALKGRNPEEIPGSFMAARRNSIYASNDRRRRNLLAIN